MFKMTMASSKTICEFVSGAMKRLGQLQIFYDLSRML